MNSIMDAPIGSLVARVVSAVVVTVSICACGPRESGPIAETGVGVPAVPGAAEPAESPPVWATDPWGDLKPMPNQVLPTVDLNHVTVTSRREPGLSRRQLLTGDLLDLLRANLPEYAFCYVGITMEDLYPGPDWNYVFGQASLRDRVAVYSFVRYFPEFWWEETPDPTLVLRRSCKVLAHETAHAFGLRHCTAHLCVMNGSNHLEESDSRPLHLCPQDLRKIQWSVGFDVVGRYRRLADLFRELGLDDDAEWIARRLEHIDS